MEQIRNFFLLRKRIVQSSHTVRSLDRLWIKLIDRLRNCWLMIGGRACSDFRGGVEHG